MSSYQNGMSPSILFSNYKKIQKTNNPLLLKNTYIIIYQIIANILVINTPNTKKINFLKTIKRIKIKGCNFL